MLESGSLFNESFYLELNSDVAEAKAKGFFESGFDHFMKFGKFERRNPSAFFDQSFYLDKYLDVANAVEKGTIGSAFDHFIQFGQKEGRDASSVFENSYYLGHQPDVANAVKRDELTGIEHFLKYGVDEGRASSKAFDVSYYLKHNNDLKAAGFDYRKALKHFVTQGLKEKRAAYPIDVLTGNPGFTPIEDFNLAPIPGTNNITERPKPLVTPQVAGNLDYKNQSPTTPPVTGNLDDDQPSTTPTVTGNLNDDQPSTTPPVTGNLNDDRPTGTASDDNKLNPPTTLAQTLSGLEKEPTPPRDMAPDAGGKDPNKNSAPKHLDFSIAKKEYKKGEIIRLQDGWVFDGNGTADLDKVEFWLDGKPDKDKGEYIQNATNFIGYSKDDRWGRFNYSLNGLAPGQYKLKGIAYDKEGRKSNAVTVHFNVSNEELPTPFIGVIDTGFSANNPDIDYSRVTLGKDLVDGDDNPLLQVGEGNEHGTHILGIIAATQNNGVGISGMNDQAPLWLGRAIGSGKWAESLIEFVDAAKASGKKALVNLSLDMTQVNADGSVTTRYEFTPKEREALEYARQNGVLIVAAAGNDGDVMSVLGQASQEFDNIITVGAANGNQRADYSSFGYGLDIVTEGGTIENPIVSTVGDDVGTMAGTSVAAAQVTGAASLVWEANPGLNYRQVIEVLKSNATDLNTVGWDKETGAGFLNVDKAVEAAKTIAPVAYAPDAFLTPTTWGGEGKVTAMERAAWDIVSESFTGTVGPDIGVKLRNSTNFGDRSTQSEPSGKTLYFDAWTYGEVGTDMWLNKPDALWYRVQGTNYWVPSAYILGYPGSEPPVLPPPDSTDSGNVDNGTSTGGDTTSTGSTGGDTSTNDSGSGSSSSGGISDNPITPPPPPPPSITINGYTIDGSFYPVFQNYQGTLGNPTSGIINYSSGVSYQQFENGSIVSSANGTFPLYGGIRQQYLNKGGLNGWLGAPTSAETGLGNGNIIQYFENGHIYWNGCTATAYEEGSGLPFGVVPDSQPIYFGNLIRTGGADPVNGVQVEYRDPSDYTGSVWTKITPEPENVGKKHLITINWGDWQWQEAKILPLGGEVLRYDKRDQGSYPRTITVTALPDDPNGVPLITKDTTIINAYGEFWSGKYTDISNGWVQNAPEPPVVYTLFRDEDVDGRKNIPNVDRLREEGDDPNEFKNNETIKMLAEHLGGKAATADTWKLDKPLEGGYLDLYYKLGGYHTGFDISFAEETEVKSLVDGKVIAQIGGKHGAVAIHNNQLGKTFVYLHMKDIKVKKDNEVTAGQTIGLVSSVGAVGAVHLHFEVQDDEKLNKLVENEPKNKPFLKYFQHNGTEFYAFPNSIDRDTKLRVEARMYNPLNAFIEAEAKGMTVPPSK